MKKSLDDHAKEMVKFCYFIQLSKFCLAFSHNWFEIYKEKMFIKIVFKIKHGLLK